MQLYAKLKQFRILYIKHFVIIATIIGFGSCKRETHHLRTTKGTLLSIDTTSAKKEEISSFISPYRKRINTVLDSSLAYAPYPITKTDGKYNTTAGNLIADILRTEANTIFNQRTGKHVDFAFMNQGGIRAAISKGKVSARTAYEVMPFENNIAVVALSGSTVLDLVHYLITSGRAHPLSGIQVILNPDNTLKKVKIHGNEVNKTSTYYVATSDYLVSGGDDMVFFKQALSVTTLNYKIRTAMIDYFSKVDTLAPVVDDRYYRQQ